jgi:hypothetical protein
MCQCTRQSPLELFTFHVLLRWENSKRIDMQVVGSGVEEEGGHHS